MQFVFDEHSSGVSLEFIRETGHRLSDRIANLLDRQTDPEYRDPLDLVKLPVDNELLARSEEAAKELRSSRLRYIFVLGIGGSSLGTKAVYDAFFGPTDQFANERYPKMMFFDTVHGALLEAFDRFIHEKLQDPEEFALVFITKSGTTTETVANFEIAFELLRKKFGTAAHKRTVIVTQLGSPLHERARQADLATVLMPACIGGRFSFLTPVGLVPLCLMGFDVNALRGGAAAMQSRCLSTDALHNPAIASAAITLFHITEGKTALNSFFFDPELASLGAWHRQLLAESIGKETDRSGATVHTGLLPLVSIGSTDLHSVLQLYLGGPQNILTSFVRTRKPTEGPSVPKDPFTKELVPHLEGKSASRIMDAIYHGVTAAYREKRLPYVELSLEDVSPHMLGQFFQFKMMETIFLGDLLDVNVFDQPSIESYKIRTKERLASDTA